ncbi:hypothetical protein LAT59_00545 [Candidatus Gracilibacteria bacterium]|nr:hypothetical protein [Candidatus Gracilibacteria bacterium]
MPLDAVNGDIFEGLSSGKKGTSRYMSRIQHELRNTDIGNIVDYQESNTIVPSFQKWKMGYHNEVEVLLALIDGKDKQAIFFKSQLSEELISEVSNYKTRLLELLNRAQ